jgi:predicted acetyltransferase
LGLNQFGQIAQSVEQRTENPCVAGSIPVLATLFSCRRKDDELVGFVLINKVGSTSDVDWNIGEFFIVSKFQGKGIGRHVAEQVFKQFPGVWQTSQIPENKVAIAFWDRIVIRYSNGLFEKTLKTVPEPKPHPMIILKIYLSRKSEYSR